MNVYTCTGFEGHWPVGTAAVIVAESVVTARWALMETLKSKGLPQQIDLLALEPLNLSKPSVQILCDGDY